MKNGCFYILAITAIMLFFSSCKYHCVNGCNSNVATDSLLAKKITFPSALIELSGTQFQKTDSLICEIEGKIKIISIVDGNCVKCIVNELNIIDSIFNEILSIEDELIFILNVSSEDSIYFMRHLHSAIKTSGIILWDNSYCFEQQNGLLTNDKNLRTFMINRKNKIIQYGNPIMNPDVIFEYKKKLDLNILKKISYMKR